MTQAIDNRFISDKLVMGLWDMITYQDCWQSSNRLDQQLLRKSLFWNCKVTSCYYLGLSLEKQLQSSCSKRCLELHVINCALNLALELSCGTVAVATYI